MREKHLKIIDDDERKKAKEMPNEKSDRKRKDKKFSNFNITEKKITSKKDASIVAPFVKRYSSNQIQTQPSQQDSSSKGPSTLNYPPDAKRPKLCNSEAAKADVAKVKTNSTVTVAKSKIDSTPSKLDKNKPNSNLNLNQMKEPLAEKLEKRKIEVPTPSDDFGTKDMSLSPKSKSFPKTNQAEALPTESIDLYSSKSKTKNTEPTVLTELDQKNLDFETSFDIDALKTQIQPSCDWSKKFGKIRNERDVREYQEIFMVCIIYHEILFIN